MRQRVSLIFPFFFILFILSPLRRGSDLIFSLKGLIVKKKTSSL